MICKYTYKNKKTGRTVTSDVLLKDRNLVLVSQVRDGKMKSFEVNQK
jgi:hypothetical protein